jgi:hypothetical protein
MYVSNTIHTLNFAKLPFVDTTKKPRTLNFQINKFLINYEDNKTALTTYSQQATATTKPPTQPRKSCFAKTYAFSWLEDNQTDKPVLTVKVKSAVIPKGIRKLNKVSEL